MRCAEGRDHRVEPQRAVVGVEDQRRGPADRGCRQTRCTFGGGPSTAGSRPLSSDRRRRPDRAGARLPRRRPRPVTAGPVSGRPARRRAVRPGRGGGPGSAPPRDDERGRGRQPARSIPLPGRPGGSRVPDQRERAPAGRPASTPSRPGAVRPRSAVRPGTGARRAPPRPGAARRRAAGRAGGDPVEVHPHHRLVGGAHPAPATTSATRRPTSPTRIPTRCRTTAPPPTRTDRTERKLSALPVRQGQSVDRAQDLHVLLPQRPGRVLQPVLPAQLPHLGRDLGVAVAGRSGNRWCSIWKDSWPVIRWKNRPPSRLAEPAADGRTTRRGSRPPTAPR